MVRRLIVSLGMAMLAAFVVRADSPASPLADSQRAQYDANVPKSILELQPFRTRTSVSLTDADGATGSAILTDLNPNVGAWYLLSVTRPGQGGTTSVHLQNVRMKTPIRIVARDAGAFALVGRDGGSCDLSTQGAGDVLAQASRSGLPYTPLCAGLLYLRNPVEGHRTSLERVTDFLRDNVWGGDKLVGFVKKELYRDAFIEQSTGSKRASAVTANSPEPGPLPALIAPEAQGEVVSPEHLALELDSPAGPLSPGRWYSVRNLEDIYFSTLAPENLTPTIRSGREPNVNLLDAVELRALVYLVAFDLDDFDLHFVLGTDHPRLDWSDRPPESSYEATLPGPDGIATAAPLVTNGMVSPSDVDRTVAAFAGGFKRTHGAFRRGELALRNHGSHYGFVEEGVIFSKLQPGLSTALVTDDGHIDLRTWSTADDVGLAHVRYARQNGVPLIERDSFRPEGVPGPLVNQWGPGNWSGSANEDLRTLRAGLCLAQNAGKRFLIYGYFSAATPSAMARVFQAYHCQYAMHLDMNALEHTYLALYVRQGSARAVEHLVSGMEEVDRSTHGELAPRFLSFPDDRDFFYLTRKVQQ